MYRTICFNRNTTSTNLKEAVDKRFITDRWTADNMNESSTFSTISYTPDDVSADDDETFTESIMSS